MANGGCPAGQRWDERLGRCVPAPIQPPDIPYGAGGGEGDDRTPLGCPEGMRYSAIRGKCVEIGEGPFKERRDERRDCDPGYHWEGGPLGGCVKDDAYDDSDIR